MFSPVVHAHRRQQAGARREVGQGGAQVLLGVVLAHGEGALVEVELAAGAGGDPGVVRVVGDVPVAGEHALAVGARVPGEVGLGGGEGGVHGGLPSHGFYHGAEPTGGSGGGCDRGQFLHELPEAGEAYWMTMARTPRWRSMPIPRWRTNMPTSTTMPELSGTSNRPGGTDKVGRRRR